MDKVAHNLAVLPGASRHTNAISFFGLRAFPGLKIGRQVLGTNRVFGLLGRANAGAAVALAAYDVASIGNCTFRN